MPVAEWENKLKSELTLVKRVSTPSDVGASMPDFEIKLWADTTVNPVVFILDEVRINATGFDGVEPDTFDYTELSQALYERQSPLNPELVYKWFLPVRNCIEPAPFVEWLVSQLDNLATLYLVRVVITDSPSNDEQGTGLISEITLSNHCCGRPTVKGRYSKIKLPCNGGFIQLDLTSDELRSKVRPAGSIMIDQISSLTIEPYPVITTEAKELVRGVNEIPGELGGLVKRTEIKRRVTLMVCGSYDLVELERRMQEDFGTVAYIRPPYVVVNDHLKVKPVLFDKIFMECGEERRRGFVPIVIMDNLNLTTVAQALTVKGTVTHSSAAFDVSEAIMDLCQDVALELKVLKTSPPVTGAKLARAVKQGVPLCDKEGNKIPTEKLFQVKAYQAFNTPRATRILDGLRWLARGTLGFSRTNVFKADGLLGGTSSILAETVE